MNNEGWVKMWRGQFSHEISDQKPWCDGYAWTFLYSAANHKDGIANFRNQYILVTRGQLLTSKLKLQAIFGWSRRRLDSFLKALEIQKMCTIRTTNRFIVITIQNYDLYQSKVDEGERTEVPPDVQTGDEQVTTIKKINKKIRSKETSVNFSSKILELQERYSDQDLINQAFQAIQSTRRSNSIADSVKLNILQAWERYPVESVLAGIRAYLSKNYAAQGKKENYLLAIIHGNANQKSTTSSIAETRSISPEPQVFSCQRCGMRIIVKADLTEDGCVYCQNEFNEVRA